MKLLLHAIHFLGSYVFAIVMMLIIGAILSVGTVYESSISTEAAQQLIYKTPWFISLLALLFINVLFSTLKRWPFKKHHTGFVITHIGLLTLLAGSMISKIWGVEGLLALREGEIAKGFETKVEGLSIGNDLSSQLFEKRFTSRVNKQPWEKELTLDGIHIMVNQFLPNSSLYEYYVEHFENPSSTNSAILFKLSNSMTTVEDWLELQNPEKTDLHLGPATVRFKKLKNEKSVQNLLKENSKETAPSKAILKILIPEKKLNHDYEVSPSLGKMIPIEGTELSLSILKFYTHAIVLDGKLVNKSQNWINPAVEFEISGPQGREHHISFSLYPDFNTLHGRTKSLYPLDTKLICNVNTPQRKNSLTIFAGPKNKLYYQLKSRTHPTKTGELNVKEPLNTGWMGLQFEIKEFISNAVQATKVKDVPQNSKPEDNTPAIHVILKSLNTQETAAIWLRRQTSGAVHLGKRELKIGYSYKNISLGFSVRLLDFILDYYPGSNQPKSYESKVQLKDSTNGFINDHRIYMNHPLKYRGYKIFQSSYVPGDGTGPDTSVFSINHDPGVPMIYGGSLIMVLGIYFLFFVKRFRKNVISTSCFMLFALFTSLGFSESSFEVSAVDQIAVQDGGRIKPFQTFARETLQLLTGKERFQNKSATENLLDLMFRPETAVEKPIIRITFHPLLESLGLDPNQKYFPFKALSQNGKLNALFQTLLEKQQQGQTLDPFEKKVAQVYQQMELIHRLYTGEALKILPDPNAKDGAWLDLNHLGHYDDKVTRPIRLAFEQVITSFQSKDFAYFNVASIQLQEALRQLAPETYPSQHEIQQELFYNGLHPFQKAWLLYLLAFGLLTVSRGKKLLIVGIVPFAAGFILHTTGLVLRILISGRAPVSNMYESMIFLVWGLCLFALSLGTIYRSKLFPAVASFLGFLILLMAESVPIDSSISQLVPVLRSNFWLTVHVLTILLSYSAFALAMGIGHFSLGVFLFCPKQEELIQSTTSFLYRVIQIGVILLVAGTILGGVWANESWGRFWGWDPKETWALISILGYLAIVHAKSAGWIENFGLAVSSIAAFVLILMTYYGVNFVLAAGLHSYGFGSGGMPYVIGYLSLEALIIIIAMVRQHQRQQSPTP